MRDVTEADSLEIFGDVTDLSPLASLTSIRVSLNIHETTHLVNLAGLENLRNVNAADVVGALSIGDNDLLADLDGLAGLEEAGSLSVAFNPLLASISLLSLTSLSSFLEVETNASLCSVSVPLLAASIPSVQVEQNPCLTEDTVAFLRSLQE